MVSASIALNSRREHEGYVPVALREAEVHLDGELLAEFHCDLGVLRDGLVHVVEVVQREQRADLTAGEARSLFSLDYLKDMNKAIPKDAEVELELGDEYPVKLHFDIAEAQGHVTYMLAPRIQSD